MTADPDTQVSVASRGAWTDEGLNTVQVRNFVNHGHLSMDEGDNLIKTPFFGFALVPFYALFGTHIWVGRALVLSSILMVLFLFLSREETRRFGTVLAIISLLQFHVFHYSHYSLAEMVGIAWILFGIYLYWRSAQQDRWLWLTASTACFSLAYYSKVTYAYAIAIPFMVRYLQFLSDRFSGQQPARSLLTDWGLQTAITGLFAATFYSKWYLPNEAVFRLVNQNQGTGRYDISEAWNRISFNLEHFIFADGIAPFVILIPIAIIGFFFAKNMTGQKHVLLFGLLSWFLLETHHLLLVNPPTRYLLPLFFVGLTVVSFALSEMGSSGKSGITLWSALMFFGGYNLYHYSESMQRRTNNISEVQKYLSNYALENEVVFGVWGTTLAAETKARTIPIWQDFTTTENPIQTYRPTIIFSEHNQAESGEFFHSRNIDLQAESDSVRQFDLWRYKVNLFWMKPKP